MFKFFFCSLAFAISDWRAKSVCSRSVFTAPGCQSRPVPINWNEKSRHSGARHNSQPKAKRKWSKWMLTSCQRIRARAKRFVFPCGDGHKLHSFLTAFFWFRVKRLQRRALPNINGKSCKALDWKTMRSWSSRTPNIGSTTSHRWPSKIWNKLVCMLIGGAHSSQRTPIRSTIHSCAGNSIIWRREAKLRTESATRFIRRKMVSRAWITIVRLARVWDHKNTLWLKWKLWTPICRPSSSEWFRSNCHRKDTR